MQKEKFKLLKEPKKMKKVLNKINTLYNSKKFKNNYFFKFNFYVKFEIYYK